MNMYGYQAPYAHNYGRTTQNGFGGIIAAASINGGWAYIRKNESSAESRYTFVYGMFEYNFDAKIDPQRGKIVTLGNYILLFPFGMYLDKAFFSPRRRNILRISRRAVDLTKLL